MLATVVVGLVVACFLLVVFRGAPYVPTHKLWIAEVVKLAPKHGTFVDLGSGDGAVLVAAARSGRRVFGIELNPILVLISWLRLRRFSGRASVQLGDFWTRRLPDDTSVVFVFLAGPFMTKLHTHLEHEATRLGRAVQCISYGFTIKGAKVIKRQGPLVVQSISPV